MRGRQRARLCALAIVLAGSTAARDPILVPEISEHEIVVRQGFTGADLLLYGAILEPDRARVREDGDYEIVVVLKGPPEAISLREKQRRYGIWVNAEDASFRSAPSFYAVASSRPLEDIVERRTAAIYELGLDSLQLSPIGAFEPEQQARLTAGLVESRVSQGLYRQDDGGVSISGGVLYQARIALPSNVVTGTYVAETFAIADGRVVASATSEVTVAKRGFERAIEISSRENSFGYGLVAVMLSIMMGLIAGRLFASS